MKSITKEQIQVILDVIYQTSISARNFDLIAKTFNDLPNTNENKPVDTTQPEAESKA
jgi:hypothetical protein